MIHSFDSFCKKMRPLSNYFQILDRRRSQSEEKWRTEWGNWAVRQINRLPAHFLLNLWHTRLKSAPLWLDMWHSQPKKQVMSKEEEADSTTPKSSPMILIETESLKKHVQSFWLNCDIQSFPPENAHYIRSCFYKLGFVVAQTRREDNHFLFSALPHANVSPSLHFSLRFPKTLCALANVHTRTSACTSTHVISVSSK